MNYCCLKLIGRMSSHTGDAETTLVALRRDVLAIRRALRELKLWQQDLLHWPSYGHQCRQYLQRLAPQQHRVTQFLVANMPLKEMQHGNAWRPLKRCVTNSIVSIHSTKHVDQIAYSALQYATQIVKAYFVTCANFSTMYSFAALSKRMRTTYGRTLL